MNRVFIIGDGGWGTALALILQRKGIDSLLWSYSPEYALHMARTRENDKFFKGVKIPLGIEITSDVNAGNDADLSVFVVPCKFLRQVVEKFRKVKLTKIISATKGIEISTLKRPSEVISEYFNDSFLGVLSGPTISKEVALGFPTAMVFAGSPQNAKEVQGTFSTESFRVYSSTDVIGVELGGAVKNVIAIAAGISDGMGFRSNTKAAILTRGLAEIVRLGEAIGARTSTFNGLSGIGDLATTCISENSRNRWLGEQLGMGRKAEEVLKETEMVVEGVTTCRSVSELADRHGVDMPITRNIYEIIYEDKDPRVAVRELMTRDLKAE